MTFTQGRRPVLKWLSCRGTWGCSGQIFIALVFLILASVCEHISDINISLYGHELWKNQSNLHQAGGWFRADFCIQRTVLSGLKNKSIYHKFLTGKGFVRPNLNGTEIKLIVDFTSKCLVEFEHWATGLQLLAIGVWNNFVKARILSQCFDLLNSQCSHS